MKPNPKTKISYQKDIDLGEWITTVDITIIGLSLREPIEKVHRVQWRLEEKVDKLIGP